MAGDDQLPMLNHRQEEEDEAKEGEDAVFIYLTSGLANLVHVRNRTLTKIYFKCMTLTLIKTRTRYLINTV